MRELSGDHGSEVGRNVRAARRYRGMSLETLAGLVGRSKGWLSKVENGRARLERRSDIRAIAEALEVSADDLLGEPAPAIRAADRLGDVTRLRESLLNSALDDPPDVRPRPLDALAELIAGPISRHRRAAEGAALLTVLPGVLDELHVHAAAGGADQARSIDLLVDMCTSATFVARHLGQIDLAWIAADRAVRAAELLDDPVTRGAATFAAAHSRPSAALSRPLRTAGRSADALDGLVASSRRAAEVAGMLHLSAALAARVTGDHATAADRLAEAGRLAGRTGEHADAWQSFGPANVGTWCALLAVEAGEPERALAAVRSVDVAALPSKGRRAALAVEEARALAMLHRDQDAARALRRAERLSVVRVHRAPLVRDLVADLYQRAPGRELRGLAWRMNMI
ncbi:helix-turn-helix domain-containing protein [Spirillospora sp. NPDC127200]